MGDFNFIDFLYIVFKRRDKNDNSTGNSTDNECISSIDHYKYYQSLLIPAFIFILIMAATNPRRKKLLSFLDGRPGLVYPMDTMTRASRISFCCAFGATGFLVYQVVIKQQFAIYVTGSLAVKTLIIIISMVIYGMVFFPVFACLAIETALSYLLGALYVWIFFIVEIYKLYECNFNEVDRVVLMTRSLPSLVCLGYLSISMPVKCCIAIYHKQYFRPSLGEDPYKETIEQIQMSYQGKHVTNLLRKKVVTKPAEGFMNSIKAIVNRILQEWIYHNRTGFRYPSWVLSVMFVSSCVVYVITVQTLSWFIPVLDVELDFFKALLDKFGLNDPNEYKVITKGRDAINFIYYFINVLKVSLIVAICVSTVITLLNIVHIVSSFRTNLFALYKGDYSHIPHPSTKSAISLCTGSIKYAGFQVAYIVWAHVVISVLLLIACVALATFITLLMLGYSDWLVNKVLQLWPGLAISLALFAVQWLLAKFVFLQDKGEHVRLDNRRFYFIFVYFMFFYNIFLGIVSCLLRILKSLGVGVLFLARLDNSTLPRKFEFFDPGFNAYQGYIHMEAAHTNPVVNVFLRLLVSLSNSRKKKMSGGSEIEMSDIEVLSGNNNCHFESSPDDTTIRPVNYSARFNWHVTYTLLQNPVVRLYRKGIFQTLQRARKEGLKVPISDSPITDLDIIKFHFDKQDEKTENTTDAPNPDNQPSEEDNERKNKDKNKGNKIISKRLNWFRKWRKGISNECLASRESGSEEQNNSVYHLKIQNV